MDRQFFVIYGEQSEIMNQIALQNVLNAGLFLNRDYSEIFIIELDSRLTKEKALFIAELSGLQTEIQQELDKGVSPYNALYEWILK